MPLPAPATLLLRFSFFVSLAIPLAANVTVVKPESAGFSTERLERINQTMQRAIDTHVVAGAITAVSRRGQVVHFKTHGLMDIEAKKPMAPDALFRIASMTKPVVSVAVLMLMEEGKIRLHDPVSNYIPEFKNLKVAVRTGEAATSAGPIAFTTEPAKREITVRDLLTHISGVVSGPISSQELAKAPRKPEESLAAYVSRLSAFPLEFQPGSRWSYSPGAGFDMLGRVVEVASGMTLDQFFQQRIFKPLGMVDTFFGPTAAGASRVAPTYAQKERSLEKLPDTDPRFLSGNNYFSGAGGLTSTAKDYLRFGQMLANGGEWEGKRLLAPGTVELMRSAHVPDTLPGRTPGIGYGLGVQVVTDRGAAGRMQFNGGFGWGGARGTHFWVDPKTKIVGVMMIQVQGRQVDIRSDFETTVMQAMIQE
jgi:CubicO group peptidase (beta-lactamase class C family)